MKIQLNNATYDEAVRYIPARWHRRLFERIFVNAEQITNLECDIVLGEDFQNQIMNDLKHKFDPRVHHKLRWTYPLLLVAIYCLYHFTNNLIISVATPILFIGVMELNILTNKQYTLEQNKYANQIVKDLINIANLMLYMEAYNEVVELRNQAIRNFDNLSRAHIRLFEEVSKIDPDMADRHITEYNIENGINVYTQFTDTKH